MVQVEGDEARLGGALKPKERDVLVDLHRFAAREKRASCVTQELFSLSDCSVLSAVCLTYRQAYQHSFLLTDILVW